MLLITENEIKLIYEYNRNVVLRIRKYVTIFVIYIEEIKNYEKVYKINIKILGAQIRSLFTKKVNNSYKLNWRKDKELPECPHN